MIAIIPKAIEIYAAKASAPENHLFRALARETYAKTSIPRMQVGHLEGSFLKFLVRLSCARRVLEIGTFTGYSALAMAEGLPSGGRLVTLDIDPSATAIAKRYWARSPHGRKIEFRLGPALETLKTLPGLFDVVFIDADKENYFNYWTSCLPKLRRGGLVVVDNVLWSGRVLNPRDSTDRAIVDFNRRVHLDRRVDALLLPIRDGVTLAIKK